MSADDLKICLLKPDDYPVLINLLSGDLWEFHGSKFFSAEKAEKLLNEGYFLNEDAETFLIWFENEISGMIRIFDLKDPIPLFDIRIKSDFRGKKIGERAISWMKNYILSEKGYRKLEGNTRVDNIPMRKLFLKSGFVKESHNRKSWPDDNGNYFDSITYGILKEDFIENKITPVNWNDENF